MKKPVPKTVVDALTRIMVWRAIRLRAGKVCGAADNTDTEICSMATLEKLIAAGWMTPLKRERSEITHQGIAAEIKLNGRGRVT